MGPQSFMGLPPGGAGVMAGRSNQESVAHFDRIWREYAPQERKADRVAQHEAGRERFLSILEAYGRLANPPRVLEVGCGSAIDLCLLRNRIPHLWGFGLDLSKEGIGVARDSADYLHAPIGLCQGNMLALPFQPGSMGVVFSQGVMEHFRDPLPALAEQIRVLAPGAVLIISVPQTFTGYTIHKHRAIRAGTWPWGWEDHYSGRRLKRLGEYFGLRVERIFGYQYWLSWEEPAWVLRDLVGKIDRRAPPRLRCVTNPLSRFYDRGWNWLEEKFGHLFLQNVVAVYRKVGA